MLIAPTRKQQELALLSSRTGNGGGHAKRGAATWIASGITIEELQISLLINIRRLGKHSTETQHLEIVRRCTKLQSQIDEFTTAAVTHFGEDFDPDDDIRDLEVEFIDDSEGEGDLLTESDHDSDHVPQCTISSVPRRWLYLSHRILASKGVLSWASFTLWVRKLHFRKGRPMTPCKQSEFC